MTVLVLILLLAAPALAMPPENGVYPTTESHWSGCCNDRDCMATDVAVDVLAGGKRKVSTPLGNFVISKDRVFQIKTGERTSTSVYRSATCRNPTGRMCSASFTGWGISEVLNDDVVDYRRASGALYSLWYSLGCVADMELKVKTFLLQFCKGALAAYDRIIIPAMLGLVAATFFQFAGAVREMNQSINTYAALSHKWAEQIQFANYLGVWDKLVTDADATAKKHNP